MNPSDSEELRKYLKERIQTHEEIISQLQQELQSLKDEYKSYDPVWYWIADLSIEDCILFPKRIPPVLKSGRIVDMEDDGTYRLVNEAGDSSFVPGNMLLATAKAAWEHYNRAHTEESQQRKVPLSKRFCGNCGHHADSPYPDDDYIYCCHIKQQRHKNSPCCACWAPDEEAYERVIKAN